MTVFKGMKADPRQKDDHKAHGRTRVSPKIGFSLSTKSLVAYHSPLFIGVIRAYLCIRPLALHRDCFDALLCRLVDVVVDSDSVLNSVAGTNNSDGILDTRIAASAPSQRCDASKSQQEESR